MMIHLQAELNFILFSYQTNPKLQSIKSITLHIYGILYQQHLTYSELLNQQNDQRNISDRLHYLIVVKNKIQQVIKKVMFRFDKSAQQDQGNYQGRNGQQQTSDVVKSRGLTNSNAGGGQQQQKQIMMNFLQQPTSHNNTTQRNKSSNIQQQNHPSNKLPTKSPYRPKLIQHLIDSSDQQNNSSFISDNQIESDHQHQYHQQQQYMYVRNEGKYRFCHSGENQDSMGKSYFTNRTGQGEAVSNVTKVSKAQTDMMSKKPVTGLGVISDSYCSSSLQLTSQTTKKPSHVLQIKYDTLKLNQFNSKQHQTQLYSKNRKQPQQQQQQQQMPTTKINITQQLYRSNLFDSINRENDNNILCVDSLEEMRIGEQKTNTFQKKFLSNSIISMEQPYKAKAHVVEEQSMPNKNHQSLIIDDNNEEDLDLSIVSSKMQLLNLQLKRSKDIIRTLTTKNTHQQKVIQMQTVQLQQLQSQQSTSFCEAKKIQQEQIISKVLYERINQFMRIKVKQLMDQIKNIKMNPLLQQSLQQFMTQLLQIDAYVVNKMLGIQSSGKEQDQSKKQNNQQKLTKRYSKTLKDNFQEEKSSQNISEKAAPSRTQNQFRTAFQQSTNKAFNSRPNAFMSNPIQIKGGTTIRVDLPSNKDNCLQKNKQNITPNKKSVADEQFRQLQKSLQKLKNMQKQLHSSSPTPHTPASTKQTSSFVSKHNQQHLQVNDSQGEQRSSYSLINRRQLSQIINQNSQTSNNLDRSKSRRKKIFAQ